MIKGEKPFLKMVKKFSSVQRPKQLVTDSLPAYSILLGSEVQCVIETSTFVTLFSFSRKRKANKPKILKSLQPFESIWRFN